MNDIQLLDRLCSLFHLSCSIMDDYDSVMVGEIHQLRSYSKMLDNQVSRYFDGMELEQQHVKELLYDTILHIERFIIPDGFKIIWKIDELRYFVVCDVDNCLPA